jgi:hypothetical protein
VLGKPIDQNHEIWKTYPKSWDSSFNYLSFLSDLFENWNICCTSIENDKLISIKEKIKKTDPYVIDSVTDTIRSVSCQLLTPGSVCLPCKKILRSLKNKFRKRPGFTVQKICKLTKEEAHIKLRVTNAKLTYEKHKNKRRTKKIKELIRGGTKVSNSDNLDFLETLTTDDNSTKSSDLANVFFHS